MEHHGALQGGAQLKNNSRGEKQVLTFGRRAPFKKKKLGRLPAGAVPGRFRAMVWNDWGLEGDIDW